MSGSDLTFTVSRHGDRTVVSIAGDLDAAGAPAIVAEINRAAADPSLLGTVLDLRDCDFVDSTGLGVFITGVKRGREANRGFDLVVTSPRVLRVLEVTGLDVIIPIHPTLDGALA